LEFINILDPNFRPENEGLDPKRIQKYFHIKTPDGEVIEGVEAFRRIWKELPEWKWAYRISSFFPVKVVIKLGYRCFIELRPYLPRKT
jgi:predicted DCC family thiol-disulfide oxidoreductase YuxK